MFHTITEGGQITAHRLRMFRQVLKLTFCSAIAMGLIVIAMYSMSIPYSIYQGSWYYIKSYLLEDYTDELSVQKQYWERITQQRYNKEEILISPKVLMSATAKDFKALKISFLNSIRMSAFFSTGLASITFFLFFLFGRKSKSKKQLSGRKICSAWLLFLKLKLSGKASKIQIGKIPLVKGSESQHILITGGTGTGKTNCLHHLLKQIRASKKKVIIVDTTGAFLDRYYRSQKDFILSPFHTNTAKWHPWAECQTKFDFAEIAESFIPLSNSEHDNYWRQAARTVFSSMLEKFKDSRKNSELIRWLLFESLENVCLFLANTKAASHMDAKSEKTASSIRSVASTFLDCLECLEDAEHAFSIREWLKDEDQDSWLFLHCTPSQRMAVGPLLSTWLSSAIKGLMALEPDLQKQIWFIIDELPSLQKVKNIETLLTEGRKYGGCAVLSLQSPSQLESIYGRDVTKTIIGNTLTKIIFAEQDPEIAERISKSFGDCEIKEFQEGISYGAHEMRDGVNLSCHTKHSPIVSASKILALQKNTAYIKLPGSYPIAKVKLGIAKI